MGKNVRTFCHVSVSDPPLIYYFLLPKDLCNCIRFDVLKMIIIPYSLLVDFVASGYR